MSGGPAKLSPSSPEALWREDQLSPRDECAQGGGIDSGRPESIYSAASLFDAYFTPPEATQADCVRALGVDASHAETSAPPPSQNTRARRLVKPRRPLRALGVDVSYAGASTPTLSPNTRAILGLKPKSTMRALGVDVSYVETSAPPSSNTRATADLEPQHGRHASELRH